MLITDIARRWRSQTGYLWSQSMDPRVVATRTWLDTQVLPWTTVTSTAGADAPSIAYVGVPHGIVKIHQMLEKRREALGAVTRNRVRDRADREALLRGDWLPDADLVAVAGSPAQIGVLPGEAALMLPFRLHILARTEDGGDGWRQRMSKSERRWSLQYHKSGEWGLELARDEESFDFFYDRMHVPTMRTRHGDRARSESRDMARECLFRRGVLAFVTRDRRRVAGMLCRWEPGEGLLTVRLVGVLDGRPEHYEDGAMRVSDHLLLEWASDRGVRQVDFGGSEPFLSLGTFQWKRKVGPSAIIARNHLGSLRLWWHARRDTPAVRDFLVANPVVEVADGHRLRAVYFHDEQRPARLDLAGTREGLDGHRVLSLDEFFTRRHL
nr:GNAT family N-acetyltransferase [Kibdelosporangium sp. MJ126-NF4]CEL20837.1 hypothetical protein [Kibdelosporangium sp. MJ126-NF4]CTQ98358.1 hypothetical protein [Kibdelosporangium sp. MJ126-NF4]